MNIKTKCGGGIALENIRHGELFRFTPESDIFMKLDYCFTYDIDKQGLIAVANILNGGVKIYKPDIPVHIVSGYFQEE